jgi:hypothetical protein
MNCSEICKKKLKKRCTLVSEYMGIPANINGQSLKSIGNP